MEIGRRSFIKYALSATASISIGHLSSLDAAENGMPYRKLGTTGEKVSLLTLGGHHVGQPSTDKDAIKIMRTAIENGVNFFDNAWTYHNGRSERRMGKALQDGYRDQVFLMTKVYARTPGRAKQQLQDSLERLQVDTIDLWQIHSVGEMSSVDQIYNSGMLEFMEEKRKEGTIRYIGFTGHDHPRPHRAMIERGFDWDTVQMPINPLDYHYRSFTKQILPLARKNDIGVIAMKTLAAGEIPSNGLVSAAKCHRYVMSLPVSTVCIGMETMDVLEQNLHTIKKKEPMGEKNIEELLRTTKPLARGGKHEHYK